MTFSKGKNINIVGSQSLKSQLYAGDYDVYEIVYTTSIEALVRNFQHIIRTLIRLGVHIGDIKAGVIEDWKVGTSRTKIESLFQSRIISSEEAKEALKLLKGSPIKAKHSPLLKFHIIRWTPKQILKGSQSLRDGRTYTLKEAFQSPTITKLDCIALIGGNYTELSCIYEFHMGSKILNEDIIDPEASLKESIKLYKEEGNRFKVIKRKFSLAKLKNNTRDLLKYNAILNSEAGKLYTLYSDVKTIADLLESSSIPPSNLNNALSGFQDRVSSIYSKEATLSDKKELIDALRNAKDSKALRAIEAILYSRLNKATELQGGYAPL